MLETNVSSGSGQFEVYENDILLVSGRAYVNTGSFADLGASVSTSDCEKKTVDEEKGEPVLPTSATDVYKAMRLRGFDFGPAFQKIISLNETCKIQQG